MGRWRITVTVGGDTPAMFELMKAMLAVLVKFGPASVRIERERYGA